jgi:hypothetical protein
MEKACEVTWTPKRILNEAIETLVLAALGILMTLAGLTCSNCFDNPYEFWIVASFTALMWIALWKGNSILADYISDKISWIDFPLRRLSIGLISTIAYTLGVMYLLGFIYNMAFKVNFTSGAWYSVIITLVISLVLHGRAFLINWRQSAVFAEQLKKENIAARYESLKNQVNPHFLFNSLNALTNLVYEDQEKAVKFIKQLSEVYRYVLDTREKEIVSLSAELEFLKSYVFLQQIRFGEKLKIDMQVNPDNQFIAPLALQMLIENAIKHNVVSEADPLHVTIFIEGKYLVVSNNIQKKNSMGEPSSGIGLENIRKRYEFLSMDPVIIHQDEKYFNVRLPLIQDL